jgi:hypothetical protein
MERPHQSNADHGTYSNTDITADCYSNTKAKTNRDSNSADPDTYSTNRDAHTNCSTNTRYDENWDWGNPYGYDLNPAGGKLIYNPPSDICSYIACIPSFWSSTNGYVDECFDGMYSHSGGVRGACSHHGGEKQPLYAH